jgi:hypothetical protein
MIPRRNLALCWLLALPLLLSNAVSVRANVYATNIKVNGGLSAVGVPLGATAQISYILNEPASGGVIIKISSTNALVRTITIPAGSPGTLRGTNVVTWDGKDNSSTPVAVGTYSFAITASSQGYSTWTQITDDQTNGNAVWEGRGIAVDQNTNSPYYGRVFVSNAAVNDPGANDWQGYQVGILKCNADASYADEGGLSTGGYPWAGDGFSPWHLEVSSSDRVYVNDFTTNGQVVAWDPTVSPNTELLALRPDNWTNLSVNLSGPAVSGRGTNQVLWMADAHQNSSTQTGLGIVRYSLLSDGTCAPGDKGTVAVAVGGSLTGNPVDVALDNSGNIYTIQGNSEVGDTNNRVFRFPAFNPASNSVAITQADWAIGANDDTMAGANGLAVDPTGTYLAVAFTGISGSGSNGCTQIFFASNGAPVVNLDLGMTISGLSDHQDEDCAWDAVGNLYYIDNWFGVWRAVSPPGTNSATTLSVPTIVIGGSSPGGPAPVVTGITETAGVVTITFTGATSDTSADFSVVAAGTVDAPYTKVAGVVITATSTPGQFQASVPAAGFGPTQFYRIKRIT